MPPGKGYKSVGGFFQPEPYQWHPQMAGPHSVNPQIDLQGIPAAPVPQTPTRIQEPELPGGPMTPEEKQRRMALMEAGIGLLDMTPRRTPPRLPLDQIMSAATQAFPGFFGGM